MPATGDFGPAPPGVDLAENQTGRMLGSVLVVAVLGTLTVTLRLVARMKSKDVRLAIDDYLVIVGLLFSWGTAILCFISIPHGTGYHIQSLTFEDFIFQWKVLFAYVMIYATAVTCTKASVVMFYRRIFVGFRVRFAICLFLVISYWITVIVTISVACRPLSYFWTQYTDHTAKGACIDVPKFFFGNGIAAMLIDVIILAMPLPIIRDLQMPAGKKMAVSGILLLGSFVCVASIVRIIMLDRNTASDDPTWTMAPVFIWSSVEPFVGIVCACLPMFGEFLHRWCAGFRTGRSNSGGRDKTEGEQASRPRFQFQTTGNSRSFRDELELLYTEESGQGKDPRYTASGIRVKEEIEVTWTE